MPTLIVEDGTTIANANTYVDLAYLTAYASDRGLHIPTDVVGQQEFLIIGFDYLEYRLSDYGCAFTTIPENLKKAQCQLVVEQQKRTRLFPKPSTSATEGIVTEKTLGPLTKKFAPSGQGTSSVSKPFMIASVEMFLKSVISSDMCNGSCNYLKTIRV